MRSIRNLAAASLIALVAGCATASTGYKFNTANVAQLEPGITTISEAQQLLGQPYQVQTNGQGEQLYIWQYVESTARSAVFTMDVQTNVQQAAIVFDPSGFMLRVQNLINVPAPSSGL